MLLEHTISGIVIENNYFGFIYCLKGGIIVRVYYHYKWLSFWHTHTNYNLTIQPPLDQLLYSARACLTVRKSIV